MHKHKEREKLLSSVGFSLISLLFVISSLLLSFAGFTQFVSIKIRIPGMGVS